MRVLLDPAHNIPLDCTMRGLDVLDTVSSALLQSLVSLALRQITPITMRVAEPRVSTSAALRTAQPVDGAARAVAMHGARVAHVQP